MKLNLVTATFFVVVFSLPVVGNLRAEVDDESIRSLTPPDVYARVQVFLDSVAQIWFIMGKPKAHSVSFEVSNAAPREVYYQAFTLLKKTNRLVFEITRSQDPLPEMLGGKLQPGHVFRLVQDSIEKLELIREHLGIPPITKTHPVDPNKTPTDVFNAIAVANNEVNNLLRYRFAPEDVYQQVTTAISYSTLLLSQFSETHRIPPEPVYLPGKQPRDAFYRLADSFQVLRGITEKSGYKILILNLDRSEKSNQIEPSDVYDIASLLVSEVAFLYGELPITRSPIQAYHPGPKFPSHVFQRAGILEAQFEMLAKQVEKNPYWIRANSVTAIDTSSSPHSAQSENP